jgi:hypothetical protein
MSSDGNIFDHNEIRRYLIYLCLLVVDEDIYVFYSCRRGYICVY